MKLLSKLTTPKIVDSINIELHNPNIVHYFQDKEKGQIGVKCWHFLIVNISDSNDQRLNTTQKIAQKWTHGSFLVGYANLNPRTHSMTYE